MGKTTIEWTDASWNPIVGCTEISPGCANCYAARLAATRLRSTKSYAGLATHGNQFVDREPGIIHTLTRQAPRWTGEVRFLPERLKEPLHWKNPLRIFVCDMSDLFHGEVKDEWIEEVFDVILDCPQHIFQILTKRPARMNAWFSREWRIAGVPAKPIPNAWLGVSVENQHFANERIPALLSTPAAVRWISAEPLLGPLDLKVWMRPPPFRKTPHGPFEGRWPGIDWVVCGGESGPNARPMHPDWARSLRDQCHAAGVPFFFKQWGEWLPEHQSHAPGAKYPRNCVRATTLYNGEHAQHVFAVGKKAAGRLLDGREWNEFPNERWFNESL